MGVKVCSELPLVWAPVLVGIAPVALFVTRQHTISEPLLDLRIFTFREYLVSIVAQCLLYGCFMGMTLIIPLTVIEAGGHNAFEAGLVLFPGALAALVFEPGAGMATDRFGARKVAIFGGCFLLVGAHPAIAHPIGGAPGQRTPRQRREGCPLPRNLFAPDEVHKLLFRVHVELRVDRARVGADGVDGKHLAIGDFLGASSARERSHHFGFAR